MHVVTLSLTHTHTHTQPLQSDRVHKEIVTVSTYNRLHPYTSVQRWSLPRTQGGGGQGLLLMYLARDNGHQF